MSFDQLVWRATLRVYVDDIVLTCSSSSAREVVRLLGRELPTLKDLMVNKGLVSSTAKEQFYSPSKPVLDLWKRTHRSYSGRCTQQAKDLGVTQRPLHRKSVMRPARLKDSGLKSRRIKTLRIGRRGRVTATRASLQSGALYGCEIDPLTLRQLHTLRVQSAAALNYEWGPNNRIAGMLFQSQGLFEPRALYLFRILTNWYRQVIYNTLDLHTVAAYWRRQKHDYGKVKGPIHLVIVALRACGVTPTEPTVWHTADGYCFP